MNPGPARVAGPAIAAGLLCVPLLLLAYAPWLMAGVLVPEFGDVNVIYRDFADRTFRGEVPYRDFLIEYPIGCLPQILLPRLVGEGMVAYRVAYAVEMLLVNALLILVVAREVERREGRGAVARRLGWYLLCFLFLGRLIAGRLDVVPALLGFAAAVEWSRGRPIRGAGSRGSGPSSSWSRRWSCSRRGCANGWTSGIRCRAASSRSRSRSRRGSRRGPSWRVAGW